METKEQTFVDFMEGTDDAELITIEQIDELIEKHRKAITDSRKEIKRCQQRIENLEYKKKKLKYGDNTVIYELADQLSGGEFVWDGFNPDDSDNKFFLNSPQHHYYKKAKTIAEKAKELNISIRKAMKLVSLV